MGIDLCSENSVPMVMSPRISFSHDLSQSDINFPFEQRLLRSISSSSIDFDFCINESFNQESASAAELFSNGKILPTPVKEITLTQKSKLETLPLPADHHGEMGNTTSVSKFENSVGTTKCVTSSETDDHQKQKSKSFWRFKRSSSLNCGKGYARSLCPLPLLSRSNSAGSASSSKRSSSSKECLNHKQNSQKIPLVKNSQLSSSGNHQKTSSSSNHQKPPLRKSSFGGNIYGSSHGNGVRIGPVLNVPSANLFGLGSIFSSNKEKSRKK